ncbi:hypothetical protein LTR16_006511, partial [Cryomyces antarcticus]
PVTGSGTPTMAQRPSYPLPQNPTFRENWPTQIPMHQPRPQKTISVTGIESPASLSFHAPQQQEQQPFHHQVPVHMNGSTEPPVHYSQQRQTSFPAQLSGGTPLSNIPERAINAQPFQPPQLAYQQQVFYPPITYAGQPAYYYPAPNTQQAHYATTGPAGPAAGSVPVFIPPPQQQAVYMMPAPVMAPPAPQISETPAGPTRSTPVAHEVNGMVYYYDPSQVQYPPAEGYAPASLGYTMPGMGGIMTPSPDGYYYSQVPAEPVYYQAQ